MKSRRMERKLDRPLVESTTVPILNPGSALNICFEFEIESLINHVGEPLNLKMALCETDSGGVPKAMAMMVSYGRTYVEKR